MEAKLDKVRTQLSVRADLLEASQSDQVPHTMAYVFAANNKLLSSATLDKQGAARLPLDTRSGSQLRVVIGPAVKQQPNLAELRRRGAAERLVRLNGGGDLAVTVPVVSDKWRAWLLGLCFVQGRLLKRTGSGASARDLPVPNAQIEVYEVDPIFQIIFKLPDDLIERLRGYILRRPIPVPPPEEIFGPLVPIPDAELRGSHDLHDLRAASVAAVSRISSAPVVEHSAPIEHAAADVRSLSDLEFLAERTNTGQFRQALLINPALIRHLLCLLFPLPIHMDLVAHATTDAEGRFETFFYKGVFNPDQPDLYFRARQQITPGPLTTIYDPTPIPCYTYWNYKCGSEVTLITTHPGAICVTPPSLVTDGVLVDRIGDYPLDKIRGTSARLAPTTTSANLGLSEEGNPWGGDLRLRLEFDPDLPTAGVAYYRVSYRKAGSGSFTALDRPVSWTSATFDPISGLPSYSTHQIGPFTVPSGSPSGTSALYKIYSRANLAPGGGFWSPQGPGGVVENNTNAIFDSAVRAPGLPDTNVPPPASGDQAGLYQLRVELFDNAGQPVDLAASGIRFSVPPSLAGDSEADDASVAPLNLVISNGFQMTLHVDNNPPVARIDEPQLLDSSTPMGRGAGPCGAFEYLRSGTPPVPQGAVRVSYTAGQRNGFATYSFSISKGNSGAVYTDPGSGPVGPNSLTTPHTASDSVAHLLGGCTIAGLRADVSVHPLAITGWGPVFSDVSAGTAFALAPDLP